VKIPLPEIAFLLTCGGVEGAGFSWGAGSKGCSVLGGEGSGEVGQGDNSS
jgi:hypothetical protein